MPATKPVHQRRICRNCENWYARTPDSLRGTCGRRMNDKGAWDYRCKRFAMRKDVQPASGEASSLDPFTRKGGTSMRIDYGRESYE